MPYPNPRVLTSFLREYLYYRKTSTWNTTTGLLTSWYRDDANIKKGACEEINRKFYNEARLATLDGWIDLIDTLGTQGRQPYKFCETLQAIRSYVVAFILESEHKEEFLRKREALKTETNEIDVAIYVAMKAREAKHDVERLTVKYHANLLKLADLGDEESTFKAARLKLLDKLEHPDLRDRTLPLINELNDNIPLCYQNQYYLIFYMRYLKVLPKWQVSFEDFVIRSSKAAQEIEEPDQPKVDSGKTSFMGGLFSRLMPASTVVVSSPLSPENGENPDGLPPPSNLDSSNGASQALSKSQ